MYPQTKSAIKSLVLDLRHTLVAANLPPTLLSGIICLSRSHFVTVTVTKCDNSKKQQRC